MKYPVPGGFSGELCQTFKEGLASVLHNLFQKMEEEGTLPNPFYETSIAVLSKPYRQYKIKKTIDQYPS